MTVGRPRFVMLWETGIMLPADLPATLPPSVQATRRLLGSRDTLPGEPDEPAKFNGIFVASIRDGGPQQRRSQDQQRCPHTPAPFGTGALRPRSSLPSGRADAPVAPAAGNAMGRA